MRECQCLRRSDCSGSAAFHAESKAEGDFNGFLLFNTQGGQLESKVEVFHGSTYYLSSS